LIHLRKTVSAQKDFRTARVINGATAAFAARRGGTNRRPVLELLSLRKEQHADKEDFSTTSMAV
jgi:hypothetical protein